jgi:hypothetical protein
MKRRNLLGNGSVNLYPQYDYTCKNRRTVRHSVFYMVCAKGNLQLEMKGKEEISSSQNFLFLVFSNHYSY